MDIDQILELKEALEDDQCFGDCCWGRDEGVKETLAAGLAALIEKEQQ